MDRCPVCGEILEVNESIENAKKSGALTVVFTCTGCGYYETEIVNTPLMEEIDRARAHKTRG